MAGCIDTGDTQSGPAIAGGQAASSSPTGTRPADALSGSDRPDPMSGRQDRDATAGGGPGRVDLTTLTVARRHAGSVTTLNDGANFRSSQGFDEVADNGTITDVPVLLPDATGQVSLPGYL